MVIHFNLWTVYKIENTKNAGGGLKKLTPKRHFSKTNNWMPIQIFNSLTQLGGAVEVYKTFKTAESPRM